MRLRAGSYEILGNDTQVLVHFDIFKFTASSSSLNRCQMTMQAFLAGLYPPVDWSKWDSSINWQPIPISLDNPLLRMRNVEDCKTQKDLWNTVINADTPQGKILYATHKVRICLCKILWKSLEICEEICKENRTFTIILWMYHMYILHMQCMCIEKNNIYL